MSAWEKSDEVLLASSLASTVFQEKLMENGSNLAILNNIQVLNNHKGA
jgi:hypothetical protein